MAYLFKFKGTQSLLQVIFKDSNLKNNLVKHSCVGVTSTDALARSEQSFWVLPDNPLGNGAVSKPMKIYNPFTGSYLANTEQTFKVTNTPNATGMVAGAVDFASADQAPSFVFRFIQSSQNNYEIFLSDNENQLAGKPYLVIDTVNKNRVLITTSPIISSQTLDNKFSVSTPL